jgi:hypothetical protein
LNNIIPYNIIMADFRATLQKTIDTFLANNVQAVKSKDTSLYSSVLAEECIRMYRPLTYVTRFSQFFKPQLTNAEFEEQMKLEFQVMTDISSNVNRTVIDTTQRAAVVWVEQEVTTVNGGTNTVEVVLDLSFNEEGTRIVQILEYVDTYESSKMLELMLSKGTGAA